MTISGTKGRLCEKVALSLLAVAIRAPVAGASAADLPTLAPCAGSARANASRDVARAVAALRVAPPSRSERDKDRLYRIPLANALVCAGNLRSARHQWRSVLRRIPVREARTIANVMPRITVEATFAEAFPAINLRAARGRDVRRALATARAGRDASARAMLIAIAADGARPPRIRRAALLVAAVLARRDRDLADARDRWFATLAVAPNDDDSSIGLARYAALAGLVTTMP